MLSNIIKWALISLIIIGFVHYFYNYFKSNFSSPKVINLSNNSSIPKEEKNSPPINLNDIKFEKTEQIVPTEPQVIPNIVKDVSQQGVSESAVMTNELSAFLNNELKKELKSKSV